MSSTSSLKFATFNIYNTTARYAVRKLLLANEIQRLHASGVAVLALQEVNFSDGQDEDLRSLSGYDVCLKASIAQPIVDARDPTFRIDGNAVLINTSGGWHVDADSHDELQMGQYRVAQRFLLSNKTTSTTFLVCNTHLHWATDPLGMSTRTDSAIRCEQMAQVLNWLSRGNDKRRPCVLLGDLNCYFKEENIYTLLEQHSFVSCFAHTHDGDDVVTCPTPLQADTIDIKTSVDMKADYILLRVPTQENDVNKYAIVESALAGHTSAVDDKTLYPSDHYAVTATISISSQG
eukprot:m.278559 g.278559  ORF g.278559 m.278559 type:complete len:291 (-) comp137489_c0_seq1:12-884(-)